MYQHNVHVYNYKQSCYNATVGLQTALFVMLFFLKIYIISLLVEMSTFLQTKKKNEFKLIAKCMKSRNTSQVIVW